MATTYPAARNLCVAATSRWCPEHLNAYSNSNKTWSIVGLSGRVWWECVGRELASSWPGGKVSFSARDGPPGAARHKCVTWLMLNSCLRLCKVYKLCGLHNIVTH